MVGRNSVGWEIVITIESASVHSIQRHTFLEWLILFLLGRV